MRILLDLDWTTVLSDEVELLNQQHGVRKTRDDMQDPNVPVNYGFTAKESQHWWFHNEAAIYRTSRPMPDAISTLHSLRQAGHEIHVVTARSLVHAPLTISCLQRWNVPFDSFSAGVDDKGARAQELGIAMSVEDNPHHIEALLPYGPVIALEWAYNRHIRDPRLTHVHNWMDIYRVLVSWGVLSENAS